MRIEQLRQLETLEQEQSITKAAKKMYMTQSALSMSLSKLEKELDIALFERTSTGIVPTEMQRNISCFVRDILLCADKLDMLHKQHNAKIEIVVAAIPVAYERVLKGIIPFIQQHQQMEVRVIVVQHNAILEKLYTGECDIAITGYQGEGWAAVDKAHKLKTIERVPLGQWFYKVCFLEGHPLSDYTEIKMCDLLQWRLITSRVLKDAANRNNMLDGCLAKGEWLIVEDAEIRKKMILDGMGIGIMYDASDHDKPYFGEGKLIRRDISDGKPITLSMLYSAKNQFPLGKMEIVSCLQSSLDKT